METAVESQKGQPEVFVLVPSYNHLPFIETCLRSIFAQKLQPRKLLVIDDGSSDGSVAVIERVLKDCPFECEFIARENRGLCRTLNEGFAAASSAEYFAYIGSDDLWLPEFLESRSGLLSRRKNAVLAYGHAFLMDENGAIFDSTANYVDSWGNYPDGDAREMLLAGIAPVSSTVVYRRSAVEAVKWNESARLEDYEMYLKLMTRGEFAFDPAVLSVWRHHRYNTSSDRILMLRELLAAQERNRDCLGVSTEELRQIATRTKFRYARMELQYGQKMSAIHLAKESWRGAESAAQLVRFCLRLFVPMSAVNLWRRIRKNYFRSKKINPKEI
ncbi:MAG: hypothetical protein C4324_05810 [Blastocatellia bacterium]